MKNVLAACVMAIMVSACGGTGGMECADFTYQQEAQAAFRDGETQLDGDNDGLACEHLPSRR